MISSGINLVMTVIGFVVSTVFIVFVCTRLICARIQLNASRRSIPVSYRSDLNLLERGLHGLEPVIVAKFPTKKYSEELFASSEDALCTVCLADYHTEDILRILPYCGHSFHVTCIDLWLQQHSTCPVCRISLREFPESKSSMQPMFSSAIRSEYATELFDNDTCNSMFSGQRPSFGARENREVNSLQENHCTLDGGEAETREVLASLSDENHNSKVSWNKLVESPSNL